MKTSRAHNLGTHTVERNPDAMPRIKSPVFIKRDDLLTPHRTFWPSYWGFLQGDSVQPVHPQLLREVAIRVIKLDSTTDSTNFIMAGRHEWPRFSDTQVTFFLDTLAAAVGGEGIPVFINNGKLYRSNASGELVAEDHAAAEPFSWPIGHDVRPAAQSLGANGCGDCHSLNAPLYFGKIALESPLKRQDTIITSMQKYSELGGVYSRAFALSFLFRPGLKWLLIIASSLLAGVVLLHAFLGLHRLIRLAGERINEEGG